MQQKKRALTEMGDKFHQPFHKNAKHFQFELKKKQKGFRLFDLYANLEKDFDLLPRIFDNFLCLVFSRLTRQLLFCLLPALFLVHCQFLTEESETRLRVFSLL
jgi:hypothetical protein